MKKYTYSYSVIETIELFIDIEANDAEEAEKNLESYMEDIRNGIIDRNGITRKDMGYDTTLIERSDNDNGEDEDNEF
jgi:hypothetical protein